MSSVDLKYIETPYSELKTKEIEAKKICIVVKREDLNHESICGNKWWKLKYNLYEAKAQHQTTLLTFGGAFSNHIYATAAAAHETGLKSIGIIRGEETLPLNNTLTFAKEKGMDLHYITREAYRNKSSEEFIQQLTNKFGDFYLVPEGGTNPLAVKGTAELGKKLEEEISFDYLCLAVGTGGTIAGIIDGQRGSKRVVGIPVLKGAGFLEEEIGRFTKKNNWNLVYDYHFGGYAKTTAELLNFKKRFEEQFNIPTDTVYTSKLMYGVFDLMKKDFFAPGSTVLILHTGGLQGNT